MVIFLSNGYNLPTSFQFYSIQTHVILNNTVNASSSFIDQYLIDHYTLT